MPRQCVRSLGTWTWTTPLLRTDKFGAATRAPVAGGHRPYAASVTYRFDLVAERGHLEFSENGWDQARFHLSEFQPASSGRLVGDRPTRIRVVARGSCPEVAPALSSRVEDLAGTLLRVEMVD